MSSKPPISITFNSVELEESAFPFWAQAIASHKPRAKSVKISVWTLTDFAIQCLNLLAANVSIKVIYAKVQGDIKAAKFSVCKRELNHAKFMIINNTKAWLGSTNLAGDLLTNVVVETEDRNVIKQLNAIFSDLETNTAKRSTYVIKL